MEELKEHIENAIKGLTESLFETIKSKSETNDTSSLQAHLWGQMFAYKDILKKINKEE